MFIAGMLLPPIAVAMRFGFTRDFFINVVFTVSSSFVRGCEMGADECTVDYGLFPFAFS